MKLILSLIFIITFIAYSDDWDSNIKKIREKKGYKGKSYETDTSAKAKRTYYDLIVSNNEYAVIGLNMQFKFIYFSMNVGTNGESRPDFQDYKIPHGNFTTKTYEQMGYSTSIGYMQYLFSFLEIGGGIGVDIGGKTYLDHSNITDLVYESNRDSQTFVNFMYEARARITIKRFSLSFGYNNLHLYQLGVGIKLDFNYKN